MAKLYIFNTTKIVTAHFYFIVCKSYKANNQKLLRNLNFKTALGTTLFLFHYLPLPLV